MEEQLAQLLTNTQLAEQAPRQQAEIDLKHARTNPGFPVSLANIASHTGISSGIRQAALSLLRQFIERNWVDDGLGDESAIPIAEDVRGALRRALLALALSSEDDRKVKVSARWAKVLAGDNNKIGTTARPANDVLVTAMLSERLRCTTTRSNGPICSRRSSTSSRLQTMRSCTARFGCCPT